MKFEIIIKEEVMYDIKLMNLRLKIETICVLGAELRS